MAKIKGISSFLLPTHGKKMTVIEDMSSFLYPKEKNMTVMEEIAFYLPK